MDTETAETYAAQFRLWSAKKAELEESLEKIRRHVDGYSRMLEGLKLLYPEVTEVAQNAEPEQEPTESAQPGATVTRSKIFISSNAGDVHQFYGGGEVSAPISSTKAVREVLTDLGPDKPVTTREIFAEIKNRHYRLDSENPLTVVRKALAAGVAKGWINAEDRDGRTKVYWLSPVTDVDIAVQNSLNDSGPAEEAGPEEASPDEASNQVAV